VRIAVIALALLAALTVAVQPVPAAPALEQIVSVPDPAFLGWNDGILSGLLGDRRRRRPDAVSLTDRALDPSESLPHPDAVEVQVSKDALVLDSSTSTGAGERRLGEYRRLIHVPLTEEWVDEQDFVDAPDPATEIDCTVWGDASIPCDVP